VARGDKGDNLALALTEAASMDVVGGIGLLLGGASVISGVTTDRKLDALARDFAQLNTLLSKHEQLAGHTVQILRIAERLERQSMWLDYQDMQVVRPREVREFNRKVRRWGLKNVELVENGIRDVNGKVIWTDEDEDVYVGEIDSEAFLKLCQTFASEHLHLPASVSRSFELLDTFGVATIRPNPVSPGQIATFVLDARTEIYRPLEKYWPEIQALFLVSEKVCYPVKKLGSGGVSRGGSLKLTCSFVVPDFSSTNSAKTAVDIEYHHTRVSACTGNSILKVSRTPIRPTIYRHTYVPDGGFMYKGEFLPDGQDGVVLHCAGLADGNFGPGCGNILHIAQGRREAVIEEFDTSLPGYIEFILPEWVTSGEVAFTLQAYVYYRPSPWSLPYRATIRKGQPLFFGDDDPSL
jgi:hypothetical protein